MTGVTTDREEHPDRVTVRELLERLFRRKLTLLVWGALGLGLGAAGILWKRPTYHASATLLLEQPRSSGLVGNLAALVALTEVPTSASEIRVLASRSLAEEVVADPAPDAITTPEFGAYSRHLGLTTRVTDLGLTTWRYVRQKLSPEDPFGLPTVPGRRVFAHVSGDGPRKILVHFLAPDRVELALPDLFGKADVEDFQFTPGQPLNYGGIELSLAVEGDPTGTTFLVERKAPYRAVDDLLKNISVNELGRNSGVLSVGVTADDPRLAKEAVDALCNNYLAELSERKESRANETVDYIRSLIEDERQSFERSRAELLAIQRDSPETLALDASAASLIGEITDVHARVVQLDLERSAMEGLITSLRAGDPDALARIDASVTNRLVVDPTTEAMLERVAALLSVLSAQSARFHPEYPPLTEVSEELTEIQGRILSRLEDRLEGMRESADRLRAEEARLRSGFDVLPEAAHAVAAPMLALEIHQRVLPELLAGLQSAEITREASKLSARILDSAAIPFRLHSPKITFGLLLGLLLGGIAGVVRILWTEPVGGRLFTARDLETTTGTKVLASIPRVGLAERYGADPRGKAAEAFRRARAGLNDTGKETATLGITSARSGEGRTTAALGLALALARERRRVLLVDADIGHGKRRGSTASELLGQRTPEKTPGLIEVLAEAAPWAEAVVPSGFEDLDLLPSGGDAPDPDGLLGTDAVGELIRGAASAYEFVLIDLPPAGERGSALRLARLLDGVILLHAAGRVPRRAIVECASDLHRGGTTLVGSILLGGQA